MEKRSYYQLREDGYIRPVDPDKPEYEQWCDVPSTYHWKHDSAIQPKQKSIPKLPKAATCAVENCNAGIFKAGLCNAHWKEREREKRRGYKQTQRQKEKVKAYREKVAAETDAIREAQDAAKKCLLERLWLRKLDEYDE